MLKAFRNIFAIPDLRKKIAFTGLILLFYRLGCAIPAPGVNLNVLKEQVAKPGGILRFLDLFSGGALGRLAIFGLGIMPYITAAIIMELLVAVIPKLKEWQEEGEAGRRKITQVTRYTTLGLALMQSIGLVWSLSRPTRDIEGLVIEFTWLKGITIVITLVAGMALLMWFGELITERGIGNGMSLLIFTAIISRMPHEGKILFNTATSKYGNIIIPVIAAIALAVVVGVIYLDQGERRIPVQYAKQVRGRRMTMGGSTYIPLKINTSGVIPIIFASSVIYFPAMLSQWIPGLSGFAQWLSNGYPYFIIYTVFIIFFAYFYTYIVFDPFTQAEHLKKYGAFVPGIRPGVPTATYISKVLNRINMPGSMSLAVIALLPTILFYFFGTREIPFGGASVMIVVGVALETMKQIESQLQMRHYEGFLK